MTLLLHTWVKFKKEQMCNTAPALNTLYIQVWFNAHAVKKQLVWTEAQTGAIIVNAYFGTECDLLALKQELRNIFMEKRVSKEFPLSSSAVTQVTSAFTRGLRIASTS